MCWALSHMYCPSVVAGLIQLSHEPFENTAAQSVLWHQVSHYSID